MKIIIILTLALAPLCAESKPAIASGATPINFATTLKGIDGKELKDPAGKALTLADAAVTALTTITDDDRNATGEMKFRRAELAARVLAGTKSLTVEELAQIKTLIGKVYGPVVIGAAWPLLDPSLKKEGH